MRAIIPLLIFSLFIWPVVSYGDVIGGSKPGMGGIGNQWQVLFQYNGESSNPELSLGNQLAACPIAAGSSNTYAQDPGTTGVNGWSIKFKFIYDAGCYALPNGISRSLDNQTQWAVQGGANTAGYRFIGVRFVMMLGAPAGGGEPDPTGSTGRKFAWVGSGCKQGDTLCLSGGGVTSQWIVYSNANGIGSNCFLPIMAGQDNINPGWSVYTGSPGNEAPGPYTCLPYDTFHTFDFIGVGNSSQFATDAQVYIYVNDTLYIKKTGSWAGDSTGVAYPASNNWGGGKYTSWIWQGSQTTTPSGANFYVNENRYIKKLRYCTAATVALVRQCLQS